MKLILIAGFLLLYIQSVAQPDTSKYYHENGQLRILSVRINDELNGVTKTWYDTGILSSITVYKDGKQQSVIRFSESGLKNYQSKVKKWKVKMKMWHPNGEIWDIAKSKYWRSFEKEFDSNGVLIKKIIEHKGSSLSCIQSISENISDSIRPPLAYCTCPWGRATYTNEVWIDEKGRDLTSNYRYVFRSFYTNGKLEKEINIDNKRHLNITRHYNLNGEEIHDNE